MKYWRAPDGLERFLLLSSPQQPGMLLFRAESWSAEDRAGEPEPVEIERDWSPTPLTPPCIVPQPFELHQQYGGDPIRLNLNGTIYERSLFIGGLEEQDHERPQVDAVLNLSEHASVWITDSRIPPQDRWATKGEGHVGMSLPDIVSEAEWVIERLRAGQSVLVHCTAGYNRSATICCAALILLEGLSAEDALKRLREEHPWARPDAHHWLKLKWLAQSQG
jgi:hypothetical protein